MFFSENNPTLPNRLGQNSKDKLIDKSAIANFISAQGKPKLAPVAVVIAAYGEKDNIGSVVKSIPSRICGLEVSVVVIVDGKNDGTAEIVRKAGGFAVVTGVNRGQGTAFRLGYLMARKYGAEYIVTADGDGQTEPNDLAVVLLPVVQDEADFVNGSRRLGSTSAAWTVRNVGVYLFSNLVSLLTGIKVTDTANSIRAMHAKLTKELTLNEPQYQAPEMLISAIMSGARYAERPTTVHARKSGKSKKGNNFVYGYRYSKVLLHTWWREKMSSRQKGKPPTAV
jgi:glycosyltransferase involved in cell wall biosynthesis